MAVFVHGIGADRRRSSVNRGTARGVGNDHPVPIQLGDQFHIGGFSASGTGPRELKQGQLELTAFYRGGRYHIFNPRKMRGKKVIGDLDFLLGGKGLHNQGLFLGRAHLRAVSATGTV